MISVITICFNAEKEISGTIESVLDQQYDDYEYIIVDGGSKDNTLNIIRDYKPLFDEKEISYSFVSEPDKGISDAFNKGIGRSSGDYIGIINAGDKLTKDSLTLINKSVLDSPDVLYGNIIWNDTSHGKKYIRKSKKQLNNLKYEMAIMHPSVFVKKSVYIELGGFRNDFKYCMDQELLARFYYNNKVFKYIDSEIAEMDSGGVSDTKIWETLTEADRIARMYGVNEFSLFAIKLYKFIKNKLSMIKKIIR